MNITIQEVVTATRGELVKGDINHITQGVSTDSRKIHKNELFVPLIGEKFNGHEFIERVVNNGVKVILTSESISDDLLERKDLSIIQVEDTLKALQDIAKHYISKFHIPVIGVTGSTGKTTTKDMIYSVLSKKYNVLKNQGNFNNHIGLPLTVFRVNENHEIAIFEMGMSGFGEIDLLANLVRPNIGVITNIGLSHIEHLGSRENILKAKMEVTNYFGKEDTLIANGDDSLLRTIKNQEDDFKKCFVGFDENCEYRVVKVENLGENGICFDAVINDKVHSFELNVLGEHNVYNALCAIAVGLYFDIEIETIKEGLREFQGSNMRLNVILTDEKIKIINDAYNASSPDSMKSSIDVLSKMMNHRKVAVLGDMLELGEYAEAGHYDVGCEIASKNIDRLVVVGENAENIAKGAMENGFIQKNIFLCKKNKEVIDILKNLLCKDDAVLVKGSRGMHMEEIVNYIQERS